MQNQGVPGMVALSAIMEVSNWLGAI